MTRRRAATLALVALVAAAPGGAGARTESAGRVFALLGDNVLLRLTPQGEIASRIRLAAAPPSASHGGLLAFSRDRRTLYALVRGRRPHVAAVAAATGRVRARLALPRGVAYRRLAVGPRTGRIYLAANRVATRRNELGGHLQSAHVVVLTPTGRLVAARRIREAAGRDWYVQGISVAPDESRLLVTYHGTDTTGADVVTLGVDALGRCVDRTPAWGACLARNHGDAAVVGGAVLAATGGRKLAVLDPGSGALVRELDTGLAGVHAMDFVVGAAGVAYVFGDCHYGGGVARVALDGTPGPRLVVAAPRGCGVALAVVGGSTLVVGRRHLPRDAYGRARRPSLAFLDADTGRVLRELATDVDVADVAAL